MRIDCQLSESKKGKIFSRENAHVCSLNGVGVLSGIHAIIAVMFFTKRSVQIIRGICIQQMIYTFTQRVI